MLQLSLDSRPQDKQTTGQYDPALESLKVCYVTIKFQTPKKTHLGQTYLVMQKGRRII